MLPTIHGVNIVVVHAHPVSTSFSHALLEATQRGLARGGHQCITIDLYADGFRAAMTTEELRNYLTPGSSQDDLVHRYIALVKQADGLVFVYPTWWAGLPAILKGFFERVLGSGVAFQATTSADGAISIKPNMRHVKRLVGVTTYGSSRWMTALTNDGGRRILMRAMRLNTARLCRRMWLGHYALEQSTPQSRKLFLTKVENRMARL